MPKTGKFSRFYLYVKFLPAYQFRSESYTYNSNDGNGPVQAVAALERILEKSCKDRYAWAKLVDRNAGTTLGFWLPGKGKVSKEEFESAIGHRDTSHPVRKPVLKASVAFLPHIARERAKAELSALETVCVPEEQTETATLLALYRAIIQGVYNEVMRTAYVYRGVEKVAQINRDQTITIFDASLEKALRLTLAEIMICDKQRGQHST